ncbi:uncharacterized protein TM35_000171340 [Trypanosoma theileri]|uniref:SRR1-like domain-containing protein n=1 Tax=Trypanosoma theileri TaxID=67003 RepID=A0A1X0NUA4_9TRYP|nr:uncharacterized protein TM35_000171340 [Trypanosoma theileri]ORC88262.1 hypothetical protein TM35_000171340 [Trypanosoma theileri]
MWKIVESKQQPSKRRRKSSVERRKDAAAAFVASAADTSFHQPTVTSSSAALVSSLARDLRRASQVVQGITFLRRDVLLPLRRYLNTHADKVTRIHLVALGIGPFSRQESHSGFLQMALLLAIQNECECFLRKSAKSCRIDGIGNITETTLTQELNTSSQRETTKLITRFFDPAISDLHARCCERFGIVVESENCYGAYTPSGEHDLLVAYLPHSPWTLLRNLFIANIKTFNDLANDKQEGFLQRTLVIGNDLREKLTRSDNFMELLIKVLNFHALQPQDSGKSVLEAENLETHSHSVPKGMSRYDVLRAFSDTAVMQFEDKWEKELTETLQQIRLPPIVRGGLDLA